MTELLDESQNESQYDAEVQSYAHTHSCSLREADFILAVERGEIISGDIYDEAGNPLPRPERASLTAQAVREG